MIDQVSNGAIGIFDSGIGGLSVLQAIQTELPGESYVYLADQAHVPYGPRPLEQVREFAEEITRFLLEQGAKLIVVACNAASAASLQHLRTQYPQVDFVGMEPAVKPAAEYSASRVVAVLATPATFQGALYASVVERFASGVRLLQATCPGLVEAIEASGSDSTPAKAILEAALRPMLAQGADTVVLGCTHYPLVIPLIEAISGPEVRVIDPAPAVARQVRRVLQERGLLRPLDSQSARTTTFHTTGAPQRLADALRQHLGLQPEIAPLRWVHGRLEAADRQTPASSLQTTDHKKEPEFR